MSATTTAATALHVAGYPTAILVITRFVPVVRERRTAWFVAHQVGVAAIVLGWVLRGDARAVAINGAWLVAAAAWFARGGRRGRPT